MTTPHRQKLLPKQPLVSRTGPKKKASIESMGGPLFSLIINSVCNQPKPECPFRLFSLSTDSPIPVPILSSFLPLIHVSCTSQSPAQRGNSIRVECLPAWNILTFQNRLSWRCFKKARIRCRESCYKRFNSFHVDLVNKM